VFIFIFFFLKYKKKKNKKYILKNLFKKKKKKKNEKNNNNDNKTVKINFNSSHFIIKNFILFYFELKKVTIPIINYSYFHKYQFSYPMYHKFDP